MNIKIFKLRLSQFKQNVIVVYGTNNFKIFNKINVSFVTYLIKI